MYCEILYWEDTGSYGVTASLIVPRELEDKLYVLYKELGVDRVDDLDGDIKWRLQGAKYLSSEIDRIRKLKAFL